MRRFTVLALSFTMLVTLLAALPGGASSQVRLANSYQSSEGFGRSVVARYEAFTSGTEGGGSPFSFVAISASEDHTCGVTTAGAAKCWGWNPDGRLGGNPGYSWPVPVEVSGLTNGILAITTGAQGTCALTSAGGVKCWGSNWSGSAGDGTNTERDVPVDVIGLGNGVAAITTGSYHGCALTAVGGVKCWGYNRYGQLGNGTTFDQYKPVDVMGLTSDVTSISAGEYHACAVTAAGGVKCWGANSYGQLGDGTTTQRTAPVNVSGLGQARL